MNYLPAAVFTKFDRSPEVSQKKDWCETCADYSLAFLRIAAGYKSVKVFKDQNGLNFKHNETSHQLFVRVGAFALALFFTLFTVAGCFLQGRSSSYQKMVRLVKTIKKDRLTLTIRDPRLNRDKKDHVSKRLETLLLDRKKIVPKSISRYKALDLACKEIPSKVTIDFAFAGKDFASRMVAVQQQIRQFMKYAEFFNEQISRLTTGKFSLIVSDTKPPVKVEKYEFFQFDLKKWNEIAQTFQPSLMVERDHQTVQDCYMDLIEALAEYNISSSFFEEALCDGSDWQIMQFQSNFEYSSKDNAINDPDNRLINKIVLPQTSKVKLQEILSFAKTVLKGRALIREVKPFAFHVGVKGSFPGPFVEVSINSLESHNWVHDFYSRFPSPFRSTFINRNNLHMEHLIGINEGDRIVVTQMDVPVILRCFRKLYAKDSFVHYDKDLTVEEYLIKKVFKSPERGSYDYLNPTLVTQIEANYEQFQKELINIYGQDRIDAVVESEKKYSEEWGNRFKK